MAIGWVANQGGGVPLPVGGDLSGTTAAATVVTVGGKDPSLLGRVVLTASWTAVRNPGTALSIEAMTPNITPGASQGAPVRRSTLREAAWRRTGPTGSFRVYQIRAGTVVTSILIPALGSSIANIQTGLSLAFLDGDEIAVFWDISSTGAAQALNVDLYMELDP